MDYRIHEDIPSNKDSLYKIKAIKPIKIFINHFGNCFNFLFISCEKLSQIFLQQILSIR